MLTRLRIQNFKGWKDTGDIRLAPLTVFFGTNSSGKSSIHHLLLMLKQTAQSRDRRRVLHFGDADSFVDLGVWPEMVFNHDPDAVLCFELQWKHSLGAGEGVDGEFPTIVLQPLSFGAAIGRANAPVERLEVKEFSFRFDQLALREKVRKSGMLGMRKMSGDGYELIGNPSPERRLKDTAAVLPPPAHFYGFPRAATLFFRRTSIGDDLVYDLEQQLDYVQYLGPLRQRPSRTYSWSGEAPESVGVEGERTVPALLAAQERVITSGHQREQPFMEVVARHLLNMGLLESFQARLVAERRKEYEMLVRTPGNLRNVSLADVGFGVSQVLPVMVQCFYTQRGSTLIFEQPELHLHPRAQSELGDLFIEAIHAEERGLPRDIQFLIESHSEHMLRRIQRRIAEGMLKPEETALYFCSPGPEGSRIEELKLDEDGNITNWPENFFGDEMGDLAAMTEAAMKRQMEKGQE